MRGSALAVMQRYAFPIGHLMSVRWHQPKWRHREERSDAAIQGAGCGPGLLRLRLAMTTLSGLSRARQEHVYPRRGAAARRRRSLMAAPSPSSGMGMTAIPEKSGR